MPVPIEVECYAGYRDGEEPRALHVAGRRIEVMGIRRSWIEPGFRCFELQCYDGGRLTARLGEDSGGWDLVSERPAGP